MKGVLRNIGTGDEAIYNTVRQMIRLANRDKNSDVVQNIAQRIKHKCGKDDVCMAYEAYQYVFKNVKYTYDDVGLKEQMKYQDFCEVGNENCKINDPKNTEFLIAPKFLLSEIKKGDCDDMACSLASIYKAMGMRTRVRIIAWKDNQFSHVYAEVALPSYGVWIPSDPVIKKFGIEKVPVKRAESYEV